MLQQKDLQAAVSCLFVQVGKARVSKGVIESASVCLQEGHLAVFPADSSHGWACMSPKNRIGSAG